MQRYLALIALFLFSLPVGISISGCATNVGAYCNGLGYGPKTNAVAAIDLEPKLTGISLSWGQIGQLAQPTATNCKGASATVSRYIYGSSNLLLADMSPAGSVCGGTWNRNSPGGIADFTICTPPAGSNTEQCNSTSCGEAQLTATGGGVTSNPVPVYIHPPITAITISPTAETSCTSQNQQGPIFSPFMPPGGGMPNVNVAGPNGLTIPPQYVGTINYTPLNGTIVTINNTSVTGTGTNGATTANQPGSTVVNATVSITSSGSAAGYFYTCPPKSIALSINGSDNAVVKPNSPQNISVTAVDTNPLNPAVLNGLSLDYASTQPLEIAVSATGLVSSTFPSATAITGICQPSTCNPAPISQIGVFGTGLPVVANTLSVTSPGRSSNYLWMASTQSQFFSAIDLTTGTPGSPVKLPYPPNSMVLDQGGNTLYFGSYRELMVYSALTNTLGKEDTNVPGVVLAVSPDSSTVVVNDQLRQVIYLYTNSSSSYTSIGGVATHAAFSPDNKNVYIVGPNTLYVHNASTGWSTYDISGTEPAPACSLNNNSPLVSGSYDPFCGTDLAITVPSIGPFITGTQTTAHGFCPNTVEVPPVYYPLAATVGATTEHLAATNDGVHILGASLDQGFTDISVTIPTGPCPATNTGLQLSPTFNQLPLAGISPSEIDQVVASPDSTIAFVTYNSASASGLLPAYTPTATAGQPGTLTNVQLSGAAQAPIAGIFSPDETIFFVGTSGDNLVHFVNPATLTDTQTIKPNLTDPTGKAVPVQMLAVKPRATT
jgi:trimeric autotransporter adhesin